MHKSMHYSQQEEDPCSTCGSADSKEVICSCSRCGDREHVWCMRILLRTIPNTWVCDECQIQHSTIPSIQVRDGVHHPGSPAMPSEQSPTQPNMRMKHAKRSKVKFLHTSEAAVLLPNNARSGLLPIQSSVRKRYQHPDKKTLPAIRIGSPVKQSAPVRDFCQLTKDLRENRELKGIGKRNADTVKPSTHWVSFSNPGDCCSEKENKEREYESMDKAQPKEREIFVKLTKNPVETDAIWSGQFEILNDPDHGVYSGLQAFTPRWVHRKAYFFSLNLPSSLSFNLLSRSDLWDEMFKDIPPDEDDVGLYILPGNWDRSSQPYKHLTETLDSRDYAMHAYIDGVELIVFTSRWLEVDYYKAEPECQNFLWGSYRSVLPKYVATDKESDIARILNVEEVNAGVNMMDGKLIASPQEVIVPKETKPSQEETQNVLVNYDPACPTRKPFKEEHLDFPPGFEQKHRLKRKADDMLKVTTSKTANICQKCAGTFSK